MRIRRWRGVTVLVTAVALLTTWLPAMTASAAPSSVGGIGGLQGVYCTSATNCWAVGDSLVHNADVNQMLRWDGMRWAKVSVPSPGGTKMGAFSDLFAIRCTTAGSCWAVGDFDHGGAVLNQILRWNGQKWRISTGVPQPGKTGSGNVSQLNAVACTSAKSCWADGQYGSPGSDGQLVLNQALRWNGMKWTQVRTPNPGGTSDGDQSEINSIRCASAKDCWAVDRKSVV